MVHSLLCAALSFFLADVAFAADRRFGLERRFVVGLDDDLMFGRPSDVALGPDGTVLVLDTQLFRVVVVAADGSLVGELGAQGGGPGEFEMPVSVVSEDDGTVAVVHAMGGRVGRFAVDGSVLDEDTIPGIGGLRGVVQARRHDDTWVYEDTSVRMEGDALEMVATLWIDPPDDAAAIELARHGTTIDRSKRSAREDAASPFTRAWCVTPGGDVVWISSYTGHEARLLSASTGETIVLTRADHVPMTRTPGRMAQLRDEFHAETKRAGWTFEYRPSEIVRPLVGAHPGPDGEVWLQRDPESLPGFDPATPERELVFDRFAPDGRFLGSVALAAPAGMARQQVFLHGETLIWIHLPVQGIEDVETRPVTVDVFTVRRTS